MCNFVCDRFLHGGFSMFQARPLFSEMNFLAHFQNTVFLLISINKRLAHSSCYVVTQHLSLSLSLPLLHPFFHYYVLLHFAFPSLLPFTPPSSPFSSRSSPIHIPLLPPPALLALTSQCLNKNSLGLHSHLAK